MSRISEDALTALSLAAPVQILMSAMGLGIAVGVNGIGCGLIPLAAYNYGAKKPKRVCQSCRWAMLYSFAFYGVFFLIMEIAPGQVVPPIAFIAILSRFRNVSLIWTAFVLAEAVVIPLGMILWKKESGKVLYQKNKETNQYIPLG